MIHDIEELVIPASIEAPDAADFVAGVHIRNTVEAIAYGTDDLGLSPAELLPGWQEQQVVPIREFGIRLDGSIVARAIYETRPDVHVAWLTVQVLPEYRRAGLGTELGDFIEDLAESNGRTQLLSYAVSPGTSGDLLYPPTGFGAVPLDNPEVRFLLERGYSLEQVTRGSRLTLPVDARATRARLDTIGHPDYRLHEWVDATPEHWRESLVVLLTRMSTDAPTAGLEEPEDPWTVERLLADEALFASSPRSTVTTAVEFVPEDRLVGYTQFAVPAELHRPVAQEDTIVLHEHRGHRLGMALKLANLLHLQRTFPGHPSVVTWNAEENRHMLDVNEAIGFEPIGYEGAWRRDIA